MTDHLTPVCEPVFNWCGNQFVAHVMPDDAFPGAYDVCVFQLRGGGIRYAGYAWLWRSKLRLSELVPSARNAVLGAVMEGLREVAGC